MLKCVACGSENPDESRFCTGCGAALAAVAAPPATGEARCGGCGATLPPGSRFCIECGRPVASDAHPGHCAACGAPLEPGNRFCTTCGAPLSGAATDSEPTPGPVDAALAAYWALIDNRLAQAGFERLEPGADIQAERLFRRQRFEFAQLSKVSTLCAVRWLDPPLTASAVRAYSQALFSIAQTQKVLLPRNVLQPLVVYPVIVSAACPPEVQAFLDGHWPKRFLAFEFPVVVALDARELCCHRSTPLWGMAFHRSFLREAETLFTP